MAPLVHSFDWPDRVVVGTVGDPGSRSFYLQARSGKRLVSILLEKEQSKALGEKIEEVLDELMAQEGNPASVPVSTPVELVDNEPLEQPVEPEFRTGVLSLGWDPSTAQVVIQAFPMIVVDDDDIEEIEIDLEDMEADEMLLLRIPVGTARAFAKRTLEVVGAGRTICMFCGEPMDPAGHVCHLPDGLE